MTEIMLRDAGRAHGLNFAILRYFNVAGADPKGRTGQSTPNATHLIKVAVQVALGQREYLEVFGSDYPTPDGTCIRDFIHVTDLSARPWRGTELFTEWRAEHRTQLRLWAGLFGARSRSSDPASCRYRLGGADGTAPRRGFMSIVAEASRIL